MLNGGKDFFKYREGFLVRGGEYYVPEESGSVYDVFDSEGRHLRTVDAVNGNHLLTFTDDDDNRLIDVTDLDGDSTRDIWIHALSGKFEDLII